MARKKLPKGQVLLIVLMITLLLGLALYDIGQQVILEYQRMRNQLLAQQLWWQLELKVATFMQTITTSAVNARKYAPLEFVADTLEINCATGLNIYSFVANDASLPEQLIITYSLRQ